MSTYDSLLAEIRAECPRYRVVKRQDSSWLWRIVWWFLGKLTPNYAESYSTTIGATTFVPNSWDERSEDEKVRTLKHEGVHVVQSHSFPLGSWAGRLNLPFFSFCYLFLLPVFFTFRAKFEREGYEESIVYAAGRGTFDDPAILEREVAWYGQIFGGAAYFYMWRRKAAEEWARQAIADAKAGRLVSRWRS